MNHLVLTFWHLKVTKSLSQLLQMCQKGCDPILKQWWMKGLSGSPLVKSFRPCCRCLPSLTWGAWPAITPFVSGPQPVRVGVPWYSEGLMTHATLQRLWAHTDWGEPWGRQVEGETLNGSTPTSRTLQEEKKFWVRFCEWWKFSDKQEIGKAKFRASLRKLCLFPPDHTLLIKP